MRAIIVGGARHGEFLDLPDGAQAWVDIRTATTHPLVRWDWAVQETRLDGLPEVVERWRLRIAMHPQILEHPSWRTIMQEAIMKLAVTRLMQAEAESLALESEKAPDTPAALFGPDGAAPA